LKKLFFLSGLPRSGSTLLGSILSQHPKLHTTPTSPLADLLYLVDEGFSKLNLQYTYDENEVKYNTYKSILENFYNHIEKPYIIDKNRSWCKNILSVKKFLRQSPKIIATNRRISEVLSSYIILIERNKSDNFIDAHLKKEGKQINIDNRLECLWKNYVKDPYESLVYGIQNNPQNIHLIDYNTFVINPQNEVNKIYKFLQIESYNHTFSNIINTCAEDKDYAWGLENLHSIRPNLQKTSPPPEEIIGEENVKLYDKFNI
jgi:sulfotransferase